MTKLEQYRVRAIALLLQKADKVVPMLIDYDLDDFLRNLLNLPKRPQGQAPYEGWIISTEQTVEATRQISATGLALIKRWEGCRQNAYLCPAKVWTIGYGHTKTTKPGMKITNNQAEELLRQDLAVFEQAVVKLVKVPLSQNQFDALVSFAFNVAELSLSVANAQLITSTSAERLADLATELDTQAELIKQKDVAYQQLNEVYQRSLQGKSGYGKLQNAIETVGELPDVKQLDAIQTNISNTQEILGEITPE